MHPYSGEQWKNSMTKTFNPQTTKTLIGELIDMLGEAQSGYIPGCGEDERWDKRKNTLIAEAKEYVEQN